jgi:hypothetical protein
MEKSSKPRKEKRGGDKKMNKKILAVLLLSLFVMGSAWAGDLQATSVSYDPAPVSPGSLVTVWVYVKNNSIYMAENALVMLDVEFPFTLQPGQEAERSLGTMEPFQTTALEYKILVDSKAVDGKHGIKVLSGEEFVSREDPFTITVQSRTPKLEIVESSTTAISPGEEESVLLSIKNVGGSIAKDIVVKVNPERTVTSTGVVVEREIVSLGAASTYIASLEQGDQANVQLMLAVNQDATLKNYSIPITMEYFDLNGSEKTGTGYLGLKVAAAAEVDAVLGSVEPKAFPGGTSEVTVDMFNIGLADARYVVVELTGQGITVSEPRQFIGTLEADDFDSFKTDVKFDPTVPVGNLPLQLKVIYKDEALQETVVMKELSINIMNPAEAVGGVNPLLGIVGIIQLVLTLVGLYVVVKWAWPRVKGFRKKK